MTVLTFVAGNITVTKEVRLAVVSARLRGLTYEQTRADVARKFREPGPTRLAIKNLVNKFQRTCSVADEERPGRPAVPPDTVQNVQDAITLHQPGDLVESWVFTRLDTFTLFFYFCMGVYKF